jgi:pimeloyl-ACP methyl ester carboxylesterase
VGAGDRRHNQRPALDPGRASGNRHAIHEARRAATGIRILYVEQGNDDGVPLILLHGYTDSWRSFEPVLPLLPQSIHACVPTQRGHGDADRPVEGYAPADGNERGARARQACNPIV